MTDDDGTSAHAELLVNYVRLLAERNAYRPEDGFEFALWRDLLADRHTLVSYDECSELTLLVVRSRQWVAYDLAAVTLQPIGLGDWFELLDKREH